MVETIIITHKDADGVISAALTILCLHLTNFKVFFTEPPDLPAILRKIMRIRPRRIIITDVGLNESTFKDSLEYLSYLRDQGAYIIWFDHHIWDNAWISKISKIAELHIDKTTCSAGLVLDSICEENELLEKITRATCSADLWLFDNIYSPWVYRYIAYYEDNPEEALSKVLNLIKKKEILNNEILHIVEDVIDKELALLTKYSSEVQVRDICSYKVAFLIKRHRLPQTSIVANYLGSITNADIVVIVNVDSCSISLRSKKCNVREIARALGGGGHARAAGAKLGMSFRCLALKLGINLNIQSAIEKKLKRAICFTKHRVKEENC